MSNVVVKSQVEYSTIHKVKDNHYHLQCQPYEDYGYYLFILKVNNLSYFTESKVVILLLITTRSLFSDLVFIVFLTAFIFSFY